MESRVEVTESEEVRAKKSRPCPSEEEHIQSKKNKPSTTDGPSIAKKNIYWDGNKPCSVEDMILAKKSTDIERCVEEQFHNPSVICFSIAPFACPFCDMRFVSMANTKAHVDIVHEESEDTVGKFMNVPGFELINLKQEQIPILLCLVMNLCR